MDNSGYGNIRVGNFACENTVTQYKCKHCDFVTDLWITLHDHIWRYHISRDCVKIGSKIVAYTCNDCDFTSYSLFVRLVHDEAHVKSSHEKITSCYTRSEGYFYCRLCEYKSKYIGNLKRHLNSHNNLKRLFKDRHRNPEEITWFKCEQCEYKARYKWTVTNHVNMKHNPENLLQCRHCSFRCPSKTNLESHIIRYHTDPEEVEWFKCEQCEYTAKLKVMLKRHIDRKHSPEKLMQCSQCRYRTTSHFNLKTHIISHHTDPEVISWFECDLCGYKTKHKFQLRSHIKEKHRPENLVQCSKCQYRTAVQRYLRRHVVTHHTDSGDVNWLECNQCDYKAKVKQYLSRHIKKNHSN